jgi:hypothetical protein
VRLFGNTLRASYTISVELSKTTDQSNNLAEVKIMTKIIKGELEYRQFIVLEDGTEVQVRYNQDASLYEGTDVQLYEYQATEGKGDDKKQVTRYAVAVADALRAKRTSVKESVASMIASGMTAEEIVNKLAGK